MNIKKSTIKILFLGLFSLMLSTACKNTKKEKEKDHHKEHAELVYQCPMNCEKGKTYTEPGNCAVCKMALKAKGGHPESEHSKKDSCSENCKKACCAKDKKTKECTKNKAECSKDKECTKSKEDCKKAGSCKDKTVAHTDGEYM